MRKAVSITGNIAKRQLLARRSRTLSLRRKGPAGFGKSITHVVSTSS